MINRIVERRRRRRRRGALVGVRREITPRRQGEREEGPAVEKEEVLSLSSPLPSWPLPPPLPVGARFFLGVRCATTAIDSSSFVVVTFVTPTPPGRKGKKEGALPLRHFFFEIGVSARKKRDKFLFGFHSMLPSGFETN